MKVPLLMFTIFLGIVLAVHLAMNGKVGASLNNPRVGNGLFWCIGAVAAVIIGATGWQSGALDGLKDVQRLDGSIKRKLKSALNKKSSTDPVGYGTPLRAPLVNY